MNEIKTKLEELFKVSSEEVDYKKGWDESKKKMDRQDAILNELKVLAKTNKTLLGRTIRFPHADSYALYVITKVNKKTVQIDWIDYCDAWIDDRCGKCARLDIRYATQKIKGEDTLDEIFTKKQ
jgi:hypothetical protein